MLQTVLAYGCYYLGIHCVSLHSSKHAVLISVTDQLCREYYIYIYGHIYIYNARCTTLSAKPQQHHIEAKQLSENPKGWE